MTEKSVQINLNNEVKVSIYRKFPQTNVEMSTCSVDCGISHFETFAALWRAFPVNIQTNLIYNTFIKFLCHIFYFPSVSFYIASIFFISLLVNLYIRVLARLFYLFSLFQMRFIFFIFIPYFIYWFRVGIFIFFLISMQHLIT